MKHGFITPHLKQKIRTRCRKQKKNWSPKKRKWRYRRGTSWLPFFGTRMVFWWSIILIVNQQSIPVPTVTLLNVSEPPSSENAQICSGKVYALAAWQGISPFCSSNSTTRQHFQLRCPNPSVLSRPGFIWLSPVPESWKVIWAVKALGRLRSWRPKCNSTWRGWARPTTSKLVPRYLKWIERARNYVEK